MEYTTQLELQEVFGSCLKVASSFRFSRIPEKESCPKAKDFFQKVKELKEGKSPIDLSIGNPDIKPPGEYYDVLDQAIKESRSSSTNSHRYMLNSGYFETKKRVAADLSQMYGLNFRAENIFMTVGAANALDVLLSTLIEPVITFEHDIPGLRKTVLAQDQKFALDEIITMPPYFVEYRNLIKSAKAIKGNRLSFILTKNTVWILLLLRKQYPGKLKQSYLTRPTTRPGLYMERKSSLN